MFGPFQAEYQLQERYFDALVKKEQMEERMRGIREMKCRAVSCKKVGQAAGLSEEQNLQVDSPVPLLLPV